MARTHTRSGERVRRGGTQRITTLRCAIAAAALLLAAAPESALASDFERRVPADSGGRLKLDLDAGSIEIQSHSEDAVRIDARAPKSMEFRLEAKDNEVRLEGKVRGWVAALFGDPRIHVRVRVPEEFDLELRTSGGSIEIEQIEGEVKVETSGGNIEVDEVQGKVELRTSGGTVTVNEVEGDLRAETSGGHIRVSEIEGDVELKTSGGHVRAYDVRGRLKAKSSGGSISVRFDGAPAGKIETSGGSIEVEFDEGESADLDAETSGGRVEVEHELELEGRIESGRVKGKINGGGEKLELRTSGGNIRVRAR